MPWSSNQNRAGSLAFTLIETLVTIAAISVVLAILLPALRGARRAAESTTCAAKVGQILQGYALASNQNGGFWPNAFESGSRASGTTVYHPGESTVTGIAYFDQTFVWTGGLIGAIWDQGESGEIFACPSVLRARSDDMDGNASAQVYGQHSYMYSAALVSTPELWQNSAEGQNRRSVNPDRERAWVRTTSVAHPAGKVAFSEIAAFHGNGRSLDDPKADRVNAGFADGHVSTVEPPDADPTMTLTITPPAFWRPTTAVPFSATPDGYLGRDF